VLTTYSRPRWYAAGSFDALGAVEHMVDGARCPGSLVVLHPRLQEQPVYTFSPS
jgi:hypothetical protein